jgi:hypothetical protein
LWILFVAALATPSLAQVPAIRAGTPEAARAIAEQRRLAPKVAWASLGLRQIQDGGVKSGTEGVPYYGEGVGVKDERNTSTFPVIQVVDDKNLLISALGKAWWFEMPTDGIVDDAKLDLSRKVFAFVGTKRYDSDDGPATVFHLKYLREHVEPKPVDMEEAKRKEEEAKRDAERKQEEARKAELTRIWSDATGKFSVRAEFAGMTGGNVRLVKEDGTAITVALTKLSPADQEWIRKRK